MQNGWIWLALLIPLAAALSLALRQGTRAQHSGWIALGALALGLLALGGAALFTPQPAPQEIWHLDMLALPFVVNTGIVCLAAFVYALGDLRAA
jgi:formate hydrogenlyase subunit 3/multisubunit Na+/H+ antiporter MnhD subunit